MRRSVAGILEADPRPGSRRETSTSGAAGRASSCRSFSVQICNACDGENIRKMWLKISAPMYLTHPSVLIKRGSRGVASSVRSNKTLNMLQLLCFGTLPSESSNESRTSTYLACRSSMARITRNGSDLGVESPSVGVPGVTKITVKSLSCYGSITTN